MQRFNVGDRVGWTSQAGGYSRTKHGKIIAIVNADEPFAVRMAVLRNAGMLEGYNESTRYGGGCSRAHESYIVAVGKTLYWPRVSYLRKQTQQ